mmetsp:Transcript_52749/g.123372  ORF Transcript_52749/g.123372 Transcript_52749/m.123372 type:complete len:625 (-) Transcript_52749:167-2041(-)
MSRTGQPGSDELLADSAQESNPSEVPHTDYEQVGTRRRRNQKRMCSTTGKLFNFMVGVVIVLNIVCLIVQADLGILGLDEAHFQSLDEDLALMGLPEAQKDVIKEGITDGIAKDSEVKEHIEDGLHKKVGFKGDLQKDVAVQGGRSDLSGVAYTVIDLFFVLFYTVELVLRLMDQGCYAFLAEPFSVLDIVVVVAGWLDILLPILLHPRHEAWRPLSPRELFALSALRMVRLLRIFRLFRLSKTLQALGRAFAYAMKIVFWVMILVFLVNLALAIFLTTFVGQRSGLWIDPDQQKAVLELFGSVGRSLTTLFSIMTLTGWREIADLVSVVVPATVTVPCLVLYIILFPFTLIALASASLSDHYMTLQRQDERRRVLELQDERGALTTELMHMMDGCYADLKKSGHYTLEEFTRFLHDRYDSVSALLALIDVYTTREEMLNIFLELQQESPHRLEVEICLLAEAMTHKSGFAEALSVFHVKHSLLSLRREEATRAQSAVQDAQVQKDATRLHQQQITSVRQDLGSFQEKLERLRKAHETQQSQAMQDKESLRVRLDSLVQAVSAQGSALNKLDVIATSVAQQAQAREAMSAQLSEVSTQADRIAKLVTSFAKEAVSSEPSTAAGV